MTSAEYQREWKRKNPEKSKQYQRDFRMKNPEKVKQYKDRWKEKNPETYRKCNSKPRPRDRDKQRIRQAETIRRKKEELAGRPRPETCELCGKPPSQNRLHSRLVFDHCHVTGRFRGWICDRCNKVLGFVEDDASLLEAMRAYLLRNS